MCIAWKKSSSHEEGSGVGTAGSFSPGWLHIPSIGTYPSLMPLVKPAINSASSEPSKCISIRGKEVSVICCSKGDIFWGIYANPSIG